MKTEQLSTVSIMIMKRIVFLLLLQSESGQCFVPSPQASQRAELAVFSTPVRNKNKNIQDADMIEMRADIEQMREEAAQRLEALNEKLIVASKQKEEKAIADADADAEAEAKNVTENKMTSIITSLTAPSTTTTRKDDVDAKTMESLTVMADAFEHDMNRINNSKSAVSKLFPAKTSTATETKTVPLPTDTRHPLKLLDDTRWRLMLNVGRVPGTWMPKTWGASGDKLRLKLEVEFTAEELYEREDFFNGLNDSYDGGDGEDSKVLRVVNNEASLAPSMTEGGRTVRVVDGGWRVVTHEGPLGTSVLRFYFNIEEETRHMGSDVYIPCGRVYGTCGYFPMTARSNVDGRGTSKKVVYQKELRQLEVKYQSLQREMDGDQNLVSIDKFKRFQEMRDVRRDAKKISNAIDEERIREPKKSSLRLSQDQSVGLTQEGGICCKKQEGLAQEYHILGKFGVASMENREHSDYRDVLMP